MGPVLPPQRKGRMPHYNKSKLDELQQKFDQLEAAGVFAKPEQVGVNVEYLNLSFLIQKPNGGTRLVTAFGEVGQYSKPQPSLMPDVDSTLRSIAQWSYIIKTDLLKSFYQIPLAKESMKFCGVATPYKGIRVYTRCAMGMPGSETCLEELMSRILGDLIQEGCVVKLADDLYCGGSSPSKALSNWSKVLAALQKNNLGLNASKTVICPRSTTILGWVWSEGKLHASPHRIATLAAVNPPPTVRGLRSYIGAYKVLSRVLHGYANHLHPLDVAIAGKQSRDTIAWTDELLRAFKISQSALSQAKTITLPCHNDELWIVTDGAVKSHGIGATLYTLQDKKLALSGFFNAKLKKHQVTWLPCEIEALCIGAAIKHFAPYIIQSSHTVQVLTDSRPCVQAYQKLCRGEFSNSSRVTTFLSAVSRYQAHINHISGAANLASDFASRNALDCTDNSCQICKFVTECQDSVVYSLSAKDISEGHVSMPFTTRTAWHSTQQGCPDLRRTHAHLTQGTRPSKKMTKVTDVKRYLKCASIAKDGLLVVHSDQPFHPTRERIIVPRTVLHGLLTATHIRLNHPSAHQMKILVSRYFFALDLDKAIQDSVSNCHHCSSLKTTKHFMKPQSTQPPPDTIGTSYAADIMKRCKQLILLVRETVSAYTWTTIVPSEKGQDIRDALLTLLSETCSTGEDGITVRVDPAPGFTSLVKDPLLAGHNISLVVGNIKNPNKNPVAEHAIQELGLELLHIEPEGGPVSPLLLSLATASMNSRIRSPGLSARELWTQRDQITGEQLPIEDRQIILNQHEARLKNHGPSARSKAHGQGPDPPCTFNLGDLVYLYEDRDKNKARDKYLVCSIDGDTLHLRKFVKSQFRCREYLVPQSNCYPAQPLAQPHIHEQIRGMDMTSSEEEPESDIEEILPTPIRELILPAPLEQLPISPERPIFPQPLVRSRKPPRWQNSDEWVLT